PADRCSIRADVIVSLPVGPEVIAGSTRMKAGTATKMALNMISTGAMILTGRVYRNMMIDLRPGSAKLRARAVRILPDAAEIGEDDAIRLLEQVNGQVKLAVVIARTGLDLDEARNLLAKEQGFAYRIIDSDWPSTKTAKHLRSDDCKKPDDNYSVGAGDSTGRVRQNETSDTSTDDR
ncbi:MAG: hypothetical protein J7M12_06655, partial [Candidatus Hydrogenedentes bacterium]|nr:hypothetical protein [Candidatus Hydrogenedentota bacterium]